MNRHGVTLTRVSLGIVYLWFGALKFFPGTSPAETLATDTITRLTAGNVPEDLARRLRRKPNARVGACREAALDTRR